MFNAKQTRELMLHTSPPWTAKAFAESLNSTARTEAHAAYLKNKRVPDIVPQITIEMAEQFLATGKGIDGPAFDTLERWVERRTGFNNSLNTLVFDPPMEKQQLATATPPVILPVETELSQDGPEIIFSDITNYRAREKMLGRPGVG